MVIKRLPFFECILLSWMHAPLQLIYIGEKHGWWTTLYQIKLLLEWGIREYYVTKALLEVGRGVLACSGDSWINFSLFPKNFKTPLDAEMVYFPWFVGQQLANWTPIWSWLISWLPNTPSWKICIYIYIYIYLCPLQHVVLFTSISNSHYYFPWKL